MGKVLPSVVEVMYKHNENDRTINRAKGRVLAGNRPCVTSVNFALIVLNRDSDAFLTEDAPVLLDEILQSRLPGKD